MDISQTTPRAAHEILRADAQVIYLDVRSTREFEAGHPDGALNIPIADSAGGGPLQPNPDFLDVVKRNLTPDRRILVGCQSGGRSRRACDLLVRAGYTNVTNVQGGFGGARDPMTGKVLVEGWLECGLPVEEGSAGDRCYASLRQT